MSNSKDKGRGAALWLGLALIAGAVTINRWSIGWRFVESQFVTDPTTRKLILGAQLAVGLIGLFLILRRPRLPRLTGVLTLGLLAVCAVMGSAWAQGHKVFSKIAYQRETLAKIDRSENLLQFTLSPELRHLKAAAMNLALPGAKGARLFEDRFLANDLLVSGDHHPRPVAGGLATEEHWDVGEASELALDDADLWRALFDRVAWFDHAKFKIVSGEFLDKKEKTYRTVMMFSALAELDDGRAAEIHADLDVLWADGGSLLGEDDWRIREFLTEDFHVIAADHLLFAEVLDEVVPDPADRARARRSIHEELIVKLFREEIEMPHPFFTYQASDRNPGVSVVDVDADGFDDFFVTERWGKTMFFRNRGDGTFEEVAAELGLEFEDHCAAALFADFDNDGDQDCFLGRTLEPSLILYNEGGRFVDRSGDYDGQLPYMVTSVSGTDYDNDGLLDIYVSTYASKMLLVDAGAPERRGGPKRDAYLTDFLPADDAREMFKRYHNRSRTSDRAGPPNLLMRNTGTGFERSPVNASTQVWRNTFQSTWADYDQDGDQDVYLANDFAPNNLLRNDGPAGFTDVSVELNAEDIGFGMGASWGDYDNDGSQDLYVTNMFSKAGRRITAQVKELDPDLAQMAQGNSLLDWDGDRFTRISGMEAPALKVEVGGWGWGSQFIDLNNDCHLDLFGLSGYYTAPKQIAIPVDT